MDASHIEAPFATSFPLPFRVLFLTGTGLLCWATNLHVLHILHVDVSAALDLRTLDTYSVNHNGPLRLSAPGPPAALVLARAVYRLFFAYALWVFAAWSIFRLATHGDPMLVDSHKFIPTVAALSLLMFAISPFNILEKRTRDQFLHAIRRCLSSPTSMPVYFSDVVLADIFTSYAKVIGDVWLSLCMIVPSGSLLIFPSQDGWSRLMVPCLMSIPYFVRFRQCIVDYLQPTTTTRKPLYNALKYASSFPVIFLSAAQRGATSDLMTEDSEVGEHPLFRLWLLSVLINSLYSFWWDVTHDWGLELLRPPPQSPRPQSGPLRALILPSLHARNSSSLGSLDTGIHARQHGQLASNGHGLTALHSTHTSHTSRHPWGLRATLLFPLPAYPLALFANLLLRLTWSLKLSAHLHARAAASAAGAVAGALGDAGSVDAGLQISGALLFFWLELAELLRRWVWVFFRVEWECVRRATEQEEHVMYACELDEDNLPDEDQFENMNGGTSADMDQRLRTDVEGVSTVFDADEKTNLGLS
ncbi:hypothetical protein M0805_000486 [Coniferiporia weirii]|nr:hypothetical protein M0805_000486 [Coniferiporia weirii]